MTDKEKVIKWLECCGSYDEHLNHVGCTAKCPYYENSCACDPSAPFADALAMLKKQEPILLEHQHKPYGISTNANSPWISRCPRCSKKVEGKQTRVCKYCGQAVKGYD